jgi:hypothetical protein
MTDSRPKFQVAIQNLHQQESNQGKAAKMQVWSVPHATLVLDSSSPTQVPKQAHCDSEDRCQDGLLTVPPQCNNGHSDNHPTPDKELAIIMLWLTFGNVPCPFEWNIISESIRNLANSILHNDSWDPHSDYAPCQYLVPPIDLIDEAVPFAEGAEQILDIPMDPQGMGNVYINNLIQTAVIIDGTDNAIRCKRTTILAIDAYARPKHLNKTIPRKDIEARNKLKVEVRLEECKTIFGWLVDMRCLLLSLPNNKFVAWTAIIREVIKQGTTSAKEMESIIGHLGYLGMTIHFVVHFLSRLRDLQEWARSRRSININTKCCNNLQFMIGIIKRAHDGINLNILVYQRPKHVYHSDLCPAGLGGYSNSGFA